MSVQAQIPRCAALGLQANPRIVGRPALDVNGKAVRAQRRGHLLRIRACNRELLARGRRSGIKQKLRGNASLCMKPERHSDKRAAAQKQRFADSSGLLCWRSIIMQHPRPPESHLFLRFGLNLSSDRGQTESRPRRSSPTPSSPSRWARATGTSATFASVAVSTCRKYSNSAGAVPGPAEISMRQFGAGQFSSTGVKCFPP